MANAIVRFMQNRYVYPTNDSKKSEIEHESRLIQDRMSATQGWIPIDDALEYLWPKIYNGEKYANPCQLSQPAEA